MYSVSKAHSEDKKHEQWVLMDTDTCMPVLLPTLYLLAKLAGNAHSSQEKELYALKYFYTYWERKYNRSFCACLIESNYDLSDAIDELGNFFDWLCAKQHKHENSIDDVIHYMDTATTKYKKTNAGRVSSIVRFFRHIISHYISTKFQALSLKECKGLRKNYSRDLDEYERSLKLLLKFGGKSSGTVGVYDSIPALMRQAIMVICTPSSPSIPNPRNPFRNNVQWKQQFLQIRNDLMLRLYFNYGIRRGELMLMEVNSFKMSAPDPYGGVRYLLAVTSLSDDYHDRRSLKPSMKTESSHRVLSLTRRDYLHLKGFRDQYRAKLFKEDGVNQHDVLFTSSTYPYNPISASRIRDVFYIIDNAISKHYPDFRNTEIYEELPHLTPKVARHTWAYEMLKYNFAKEYKEAVNIAAHTGGQFLSEREIMANAVDSLRRLGGWSNTSQMPMNYGRRFFAEHASVKNLQRINDDAEKARKELEAHIETKQTEDVFDAF